MYREVNLTAMRGAELVKMADEYGIKVSANKERTQLKESKSAVVARILEHEDKLKKAEEAKKAEKAKKSNTPKKKANKRSKLIEFNGKALTITEWARELNMPSYVLWDRIRYYNWPIERALTTPLKANKRTKEEYKTSNIEQEN